jgi:two-component system nitrate/nitrite response regulator NarL
MATPTIATVSSPPIRVLAVDRTIMNSQMLADSLSRDNQLRICGSAVCSAGSTLAAVGAERPDVVILSSDLEDGASKGFEVARGLLSVRPGMQVVMLLDSSERNHVIQAFRAGAQGVFCRTQPLSLLAKCVRSVHTGQVWANSRELLFLLQVLGEKPVEASNTVCAGLSKREWDVVRAVAQGQTNREIAGSLGLSEHTVKNYLYRIFDKLGVSTRVELVLQTLESVPPRTHYVDSPPVSQKIPPFAKTDSMRKTRTS